jgi:hypothetical protein
MSDVDADRGKGDGGQEISGKFVVACGDPAQMLEFVEEALDQVALAIAFEVDGAYHPELLWLGMWAVVPRVAKSSMMLRAL